MPHYGHDIEFGYFLTPDAGDPGGALETARLADRLGYDLLAVQDHPYQPAHLDACSLSARTYPPTSNTKSGALKPPSGASASCRDALYT
jgi:alkanesulfonate monooxygenase SsuD/methylene tetrahydromethanopterin reductase-like flavin-dependent oxidoreductase (luciferase family)